MTNQKDRIFLTNQNEAGSNLHQSNSPKKTLIKPEKLEFELLERESANQIMLHAKMMMDPVISLILFNEYIPLQQPKEKKNKNECEVAEGGEDNIINEIGGLFLGKMEDDSSEKNKESSSEETGLFIRSEPDNSGSLFIRSEDSSITEDWVIA